MQPLPDDDFYAERGSWPSNLGDRDARLVLAAVLDLTDDDRTRHEPVRVSAQNEVVILSGTVASWAARDAAATVARHTPGAQDLCNLLQVIDDAQDATDHDRFDSLVAPMVCPPQPDDLTVAGPPRGRTRRLAILLTAFAWCALPVAIFAAHLPAVPALIVVLAGTMTAASLRLVSSRV